MVVILHAACLPNYAINGSFFVPNMPTQEPALLMPADKGKGIIFHALTT